MAAPGWYQAEGDPPGSRRYWDGASWIGDPVYEPPGVPIPAPHGVPGVPPRVKRLAPGGRVIAILLSVLKLFPILLTLFFVGLYVIIGRSLDEELDNNGEFADAIVAVAGLLLLILASVGLVGLLLIGFQFFGAIGDRPTMVLVPAAIMALLDALFTFGAWSSYVESRNDVFRSDEVLASPLVMTFVCAAQFYVAIEALKARRR